jgi:hypothetical protein
VTVALLDFTFSATGPSGQTVIPGSAASFSYTITPLYGRFADVVSFTVTGLPPGATASLTPSTVAAASNGLQTVTLTIQTAGAIGKMSNPFDRDAPLFACVLLPLMGWKRIRRGVLLAVVLLACLTSLEGCGAGNGFLGQSPKDYTVTITAKAGSVQHSSTVTLNVQ